VRAGPSTDGVADGPYDVEGLLVTEPPPPGRPGDLPGRAGIAKIMITAWSPFEVSEHRPQRGLAEAT
jgi:hypothetical protein